MDEKRFTCRLDRRSRRITPAVVMLIAGGCVALHVLGAGDYVSAWFLTFAIAILGLYILSIPRYVKVSDRAVEIICVLETTEIQTADIASARRIDRSETRGLIPVLGSYGFFGYYGYYLDTRSWETVKVYAGNWAEAVEIVDIFEQRYIVSTPDADNLVAAVEQARSDYAQVGEKM